MIELEEKTDSLNQLEEQLLVNGDNSTNNKGLYYDLPKTIGSVLNYMGRYQKVLFIALALNGIIYGINHTLTAFHIYTPEFFCDDVPDNHCGRNGTCPSGFRFNKDDYTIVVEYELVCTRRYLAPLVNTLYFCGVTMGALICGIWTDKYGRKIIMFLCLFVQGVIGLLLRTTTMLEIFIALRTVQGFFVQGLQGCCVALLFEYSAPRLRNSAIVAWHFAFSCGALLLGATSFGVRDWRMLQVMISIPTMIIASYIWVVPESIFWLYATNRKQQSLKLCLKTAKLNGDTKMVTEIQNNYKTELEESTTQSLKGVKIEEKIEKKETAGLLDIWHSVCLRKHLVVMCIVNYVITVGYYGSMFFLNNVKGNRHVNFMIGSCVEMVALVFLLILLRKLGTRFSIVFCQYSTGIICGIIGLVIAFIDADNPNKVIIVRILSLTTKSFAISAFAAMIMFNSELFPTICRGAAFGTCGFFARMGSITAPFFMLMAEISPIIPMTIICLLLITTGTMTLMMPNTRDQILPHTIADAKQLWEKTK